MANAHGYSTKLANKAIYLRQCEELIEKLPRKSILLKTLPLGSNYIR
jgi:hypothetical protein